MKEKPLIEQWNRWGRTINGKRFILISIAKTDLRKVIVDFNLKMASLQDCIDNNEALLLPDYVSIVVEWNLLKQKIFGDEK